MPSEDIEGISYSTLTPSAAGTSSVSTYNEMLSSFSTEIAEGEFTEVDSALFEGFTNAASSRLFSSETMRDKILGAKYFDRVLYVLVDPDEFLVLTATGLQALIYGGAAPPWPSVETKVLYQSYQDVLIMMNKMQYVNIDGTPSQAAGNYMKVTTRVDEGESSFAEIMYTIVRAPEGIRGAKGITMGTKTEDERDEMIRRDSISAGGAAWFDDSSFLPGGDGGETV